MSEQGDPGAVHHGAIGSGDGVDYGQYADDANVPEPGYSEPPEWLAPIEARMAELQDQNYALAAQIQQQQGYADDDVEYYDDDEDYDEDEGVEDDTVVSDDVLDLFDEAIDRRMAEVGAEEDRKYRDEAFEDLRDQYTILQDPDVCYAVVKRAQALAESMNPEIIETSGFIDLVEAVAKATMVDQATTWNEQQNTGASRSRFSSKRPLARHRTTGARQSLTYRSA